MVSSSGASWRRLSLVLEDTEIASAEEMLTRAGAVGISIADAADSPLLEPAPGATPLWPVATLSALFPPAADLAPIVAALEARFGTAATPAVRALAAADWQPQPSTLKAPLMVGRRLAIGAADTPARPPRSLLKLNLGLAFGTGTHPTTALCLEWLEREIGPGARVLDYGCGSGILGLAALVLGASEAWAVDIEPQALTATRENARLNGLEGRIWVGPPQALGPVAADVVVANILAQPLVELAGTLAGRLRPGGALVLSGVLSTQSDMLETAYRETIGDFERTERDGWVRLNGRRSAAVAV